MFNFFSLFRRSESDGGTRTVSPGYAAELAVVIFGLIIIGIMAFWMSSDVMDGLYRQIRLLIAAVAVLLLGYAFRLPTQLNFRRTLLLSVVIILQLFFSIAINGLCG